MKKNNSSGNNALHDTTPRIHQCWRKAKAAVPTPSERGACVMMMTKSQIC